MKINPLSFGLAIALSVAVLWSIYSVGAFSLMVATINLSGAYTNFGSFDWSYFLSQFLISLIALCIGSGVTGWLIAVFYNCLNENSEPKLS